MSDGFQRVHTGAVVATLSGFEGDLLRSLASQLIELLHSESAVPDTNIDPFEAMLDFAGPTTPPEDPVLARLFPTAYSDDESAAGEFRRFTESSLREKKSEHASQVIDDLEDAGLPTLLEEGEEGLVIDVELDRPGALTWMKCFTDMRLALATRIGITDDDQDGWEDLPAEDPRSQIWHIYNWLGYLQETLVGAVSR